MEKPAGRRETRGSPQAARAAMATRSPTSSPADWGVKRTEARVSQRDSSQNGYDWTAIYDGLGRRISTTLQPVANNVDTGAPTVTASIYDPQVKFMEIGVSVNGAKAWLVRGPDANGVYGGMQGTGGLEATVMDAGGAATGVINDYFGNGVATISGGALTWNTTHCSSYGPLPDSSAQPLTDATQLAQSMVWRGHRIDPTGFYYVGHRYYEPTSGRWLSCDPLGFAASTSLYEFCGNDPLNFFDPDGLQSQEENDMIDGLTARQNAFANKPNGTNGTAQLLVQAGATIVQDATVTVSANGAGASVGGDGSVGVNAGPVSITRDANGNIVMSASQSVGTVTGTVSTNSSSPSTVTGSVTNGPPPVTVGPVSVSIDPSKGSIPNPSANPVISNTNNGGDVNSPPSTNIGPVSVSVDPSKASVNASIDLGKINIQNPTPSPNDNQAVNSGSKCKGH